MKKLLALLLAVAMLVTLCACGKKDKDDKGVSNDPEAVAEAFVKAYALDDYVSMFDLCAFDFEAAVKDESLEDYDSEDEYFEDMSAEYGEKVTSWSGLFKTILKDSKDYLKKEYGDDYKIKVKATDTEELDKDETENVIDEMLDEYEGYVDEDAVKDVEEAMKVTVEASISGEDGEDTAAIIVTVVKIDGKWKVAGYGYGNYDDDDYDDYYDEDDYDDYYGSYDEDEYYDER